MARILVADDGKVDRALVRGLLSKDATLDVETADDGQKAWDRIQRERPDLLLTDLVMPHLDGLELTAKVRKTYPAVPVILMTARGSEEIAVKALQAGASGYVPKARLAIDLLDTIRRVLEMARLERDFERLREAVVETHSTYLLPNDCSLVPALVKRVQDDAFRLGLSRDETDAMRLGVALHEALVNAAHHGNLELSSELREEGQAHYEQRLAERLGEEPVCRRKVFVETHIDRKEARILVRDEGPGFDPSTLPDPRAPENLEKASGRGVLLMRTFMDVVEYNDAGNQVEMVFRRQEG